MTPLWENFTPTAKTIDLDNVFSTLISNVVQLRGAYYGTTADFKNNWSTCSTLAAPGNITLPNYQGIVSPYNSFVVNNYSTNISIGAFTQC